MGPRFPLPGGQSQSGGGCSTTEEEASVRDLRTKGPQEQRSLQSLLAALGPVRSPDLSSLLDPTSGMSAVWSGQRKGALGRQGKPLYQKLRTRVAWLAQRTDVSAVANYFRVTWRSVRRIIQRVVAEQRDERRELDGLRVIGMDEISYRKRHKYLTASSSAALCGPSLRKNRSSVLALRSFPAQTTRPLRWSITRRSSAW